MPLTYLGLGSNKGERLAYIEKAVEEISRIKSTSVIRISSVYETEPWGIREQNFFLNCVAEIECGLDVFELASKLKTIEKILGRTNSSKWHEREIDIDLLFFGDIIIDESLLKIPHPGIAGRNFVLVPLNELAPELVHPVSCKSIVEMLNETTDNLGVNVFGTLSYSGRVS